MNNYFCFRRVHTPLISVKIKIAFITASSYRALPFKGNTAHISVNTVVAQAEGTCQLFTAQHLAVLHIGTLQNIYPVMLAVVFNYFEFESCISVEHSADYLVEDLKEPRPDKRKLRCNMQAFPIRLYTDSYGLFYQGDSFFTRDIFDHLKIYSRPRENHTVGVYLFLFWEAPYTCRIVRCKESLFHNIFYQSYFLFLRICEF